MGLTPTTARVLYGCGWLLVAAIVYGSLSPTPVEHVAHVHDKLQHIGAYFLTAAWFGVAIARDKSRQRHWAFLGLLAVAMEFGQLAVPGRSFEYTDMAISLAGVLTAAIPFQLLHPGTLHA